MQKLILFTLLIVLSIRSNAQSTATFVLVTGGCDTNQVLAVNFSGGTPPYSVEWIGGTPGGGAYHVGITGLTDTLHNFAGGVTSVTVYSSTYSVAATGSYTEVPTLTFTFAPVPAFCGTVATVSVNITGGTAPYSYNWYTAYSGYSSVSTSNPASLPSGYYGINITDAAGCFTGSGIIATMYGNYYDSISPTPTYVVSVTSTSANCTDGTASVTGVSAGAVSPVSYLWSNGATTSSISGLVQGFYELTTTDAAGCVAMSEAYIEQVTVITPEITSTPATCVDSDGAAIGFGSGGTPPYTYLWSNGATTASISGLPAADYDLTVTDINGCFGTGYAYLSSSTPITVTYSTTPSSCTTPTGSATLIITGGTAPYTITWYTSPTQTGTTATGLPAGNYYFYITDALGCIQSGTVTIPPVDVINLSFSASAATCLASDGSVAVYASGGVAPYTYSWSSGSSTSSSLTNVPYGTYYATVTDAHGCSVTNCKLVPYNSPLELELSSTPASCLYTSNGSIAADASLGTPPYTYSMGGSSSGSVTVSSLATGAYWVYVTDALGCTAWDYTYVDYNAADSSCFCVVKGTVYDDISHDCLQETGEPGIQNIQLQCSGLGYTYSDPGGNYYFLVPSGTYTISQTVLSVYPLSPCQSNNIAYTAVAATGCSSTINFADTLDPIHDVQISTWDYTMPRPGFPYTQVAVITNEGTLTESNILGSYDPDGQIYAPSFVPYGVFTGAPYNYYTPDSALSLTPGAGQRFLMTYNVPADIPLGTNVIFKDSVAYKPPMTNWLNDYSPWNNVNYFTTTTVGSYDPNFKEVSPKGTGSNGTISTQDSVLQYMVHFQNVGSYMAENVVVKDTLDANLDWSTLRPVYMSDKCVVTVNETGIATFTFNNINLPSSSSEPVTSNGMFTYTIKQKPGLTFGTQIKNNASIYFDFNAPVKTNTTLNTIGWPTQVTQTTAVIENNSFKIYPNPAQTTFNAIINLDADGAYMLKVCDVTGKTEICKSMSLQKGSQTVTVDASTLSPGIYFVTFSGNTQQTQKLVILK